MPNIAITDYCNLRCPYCFANSFIEENATPNYITPEELNRIFEFLATSSQPLRRIGIIGGEPTLHPQFSTILTQVKQFAQAARCHVTIFSNGIELADYIPFLDDRINCLLNLNEPWVIGEENFKKIMFTLNRLKARDRLRHIALGINLYPNMKDYAYIFPVAKEYFIEQVRCSYVAPTCQFSNTNKNAYYSQAKELFLNFVKSAKANHIKINLDCNRIPSCFFSASELELVKSIVVNFQNSYCDPVIDITPDFKATSCFGSYHLIDLSEYETYDDAQDELAKYMDSLRILNQEEICKTCEQWEEKKCQGGCLAFAKSKINNDKK